MYDIILQSIFFISLAVLIYLFARALPRVDDSGKTDYRKGVFDRMLAQLPLREVDSHINASLEKFLRKMKILVMKSDNVINERLHKIKKVNAQQEEESDEKSLFKEENSDTKK